MANAKKPPDNPITPPAREAFELYLRDWQERLNLRDWRIVFSPKTVKGACAEVTKFDLPGRVASIRLGEHFGSEPVDDVTLEDTAVHELLHVLLKEFKELVASPTATEDDIFSAEHRVIQTVVNLLVHDR